MTMPGRGRAFLSCSLLVGSLAFAGCEKDQFRGAEAEVGRETIKPSLPDVPSFELPAVAADGSHSVKEMRVRGRKYLDQEVTVKGYVVWIYDCATAIRTPEMSDAEVRKIITEDPMRCSRPKFRIGDSPDAGEDRSIKVVEVPRHPTEQERKVLKDEIKDPTIWRPVPPLQVGDEVVVTGNWKQRAPHGDADMEGLLVYQGMKNLSQTWETQTALAEKTR
jgi:hypothetical protein